MSRTAIHHHLHHHQQHKQRLVRTDGSATSPFFCGCACGVKKCCHFCVFTTSTLTHNGEVGMTPPHTHTNTRAPSRAETDRAAAFCRCVAAAGSIPSRYPRILFRATPHHCSSGEVKVYYHRTRTTTSTRTHRVPGHRTLQPPRSARASGERLR